MFNKNLIHNFILDFLKENNVDDLSFSLISKKTKISRTTLYSHYAGIWEIIDEINEFYINQIVDIINDIKLNISVFPTKKNLTTLLSNIYKNKKYYCVANKIQEKNHYKYIEEIISKKRKEFLDESLSDEKQIYYIDNCFGISVQYMIGKWIQNNFMVSIDDEVNVIDTYCKMVLK